METEFNKIAKKIAEFIPVKHYIAFLDTAGNILYSSISKESEENLKKLTQIFPICDVGDFQVKKLKKTNMIVYKISPDTFLAIESYEKEGVIISAAKRLEEKYTELFETPKKPFQTPPPLIQEVSGTVKEEGSSVEEVKEAFSTVETKKPFQTPPPLIQEVSGTVKEEGSSVEEVKEAFSTVETRIAEPTIKGEEGLKEIMERLAKIDTLIQKKKRKLTST